MSRAEAEEVVLTALALAMSRDGSSGGLARLTTVTKDGAQARLPHTMRIHIWSCAPVTVHACPTGPCACLSLLHDKCLLAS